MKGGAGTKAHNSVLAVALDKMWTPLASVNEDEKVNRERQHLL